MPAAKTAKTAPAGGAAGKAKATKPAPSPAASGTVTPTLKADDESKMAPDVRSGKPDKTAYDAEQEAVKKEIDVVQVKLNGLQDKISSISSSGSGNERRLELRAEWDKIRQDQSKSKTSRGKVMDQLKALNEGIQKKIKDLQAAKGKTPFKSVAEVDAHIKQLDKRVESGSMTLAEEKRALQEISQCKRTRKAVEAFEADQQAIERDRAAADELRRQLDDPEAKAVSERADTIKAELDEIKKEGDVVYSNRNKLFDERNELRAELDALYGRKRDSAQKYREDQDRYWSKVNEDRARRAEKARAQRTAEEEQKKKDISERLREEAEAPAFQAQIEDCQTLIDYFSGKVGGGAAAPTAGSGLSAKTDVAGVPKLELRQVDREPGEGLVVRKKKGADEEAYVVMGKGKGKGKKGGAKSNGASDTHAAAPSNAQLNVPLPTLTALLSLSIPPPASTADVARTVADLKTKKAWFEANQARVTAENVAKAEADIKRLLNGSKVSAEPAPLADVPPGGGGERPPEPASTPSVGGTLSTAVPSEEVGTKLESVQEAEAVEETA